MSRTSMSLCVGVAILVICLCDLVLTEGGTLSRQKRGFRVNSANRVAHGYGKRDYVSSQVPLGPLEISPNFIEDSEGSIMTVSEFAQLLISHPNLARALLKKFVDVDGDDVISTEELLRPTNQK